MMIVTGTMPDIGMNVIGSLDMTIQPIRRPSLFQHDYYRGDKKKHIFNNFAIADAQGILLNYEPSFIGHSNDSRCFTLSSVGSGMKSNQNLTNSTNNSTLQENFLYMEINY